MQYNKQRGIHSSSLKSGGVGVSVFLLRLVRARWRVVVMVLDASFVRKPTY